MYQLFFGKGGWRFLSLLSERRASGFLPFDKDSYTFRGHKYLKSDAFNAKVKSFRWIGRHQVVFLHVCMTLGLYCSTKTGSVCFILDSSCFFPFESNPKLLHNLVIAIKNVMGGRYPVVWYSTFLAWGSDWSIVEILISTIIAKSEELEWLSMISNCQYIYATDYMWMDHISVEACYQEEESAASSGLFLSSTCLLSVIQHPVVLLLSNLRVNILWSPAED